MREKTVKIGVLGTGFVGGTLGRRWAEAGHQVWFGSRDPDGDKAQTLLANCPANTRVTSWIDAVEQADVILLALPWSSVEDILKQLDGALDGKILIDCVNPLNSTFSGLELGFTSSAAEEIAQWAPRSRVVKAFNTLSAAVMADPMFDGVKAAVFYCGDDAPALEVVGQLANDLDFDAIVAGPLQNARYLEPFSMLYIHLAMNGWGSQCAFQVLTRPKPQ
ncbi:MAG TPA: F420-dependent NADP oxidoreductase [Planctomycetaceae bacterium]|nr:F420-dependent NADP oxidoreductase [Planctomycetaceae bacterium]